MKQVNEFMDSVQKFIVYRADKVEATLTRTIKKFNVFRLKIINGVCYKQFKKTDLDGFKLALNIDGTTSRVVGYTPWHVGIRPSSPVTAKNFISEATYNNFDDIKQRFPELASALGNVLSNYRGVYLGSYDSNSKHLAEHFKHQPLSMSRDSMFRIAVASGWFYAPSLSFKDFREVYYTVNFNPHASPGPLTSVLSPFANKGAHIEDSLLMAKIMFDLYNSYPLDNYNLWSIQSREKDFKIDYAEDDEPSTRVVMCTEMYVTILHSWVMQKLQKALDYSTGQFFLGGEYTGDKATLVYDKFKDSDLDYIIDVDWQVFDATQTEDEMLVVLSLVLSDSWQVPEDMRFIYSVVSSMIRKFYIVPPGVVVETVNGLPSGHPGVTIVNCLVNILRWACIGYRIYGPSFRSKMAIVVYGDDGLIAFKDHPRLWDVDQIIADLGYKADPIGDNFYPLSMFGVYEHEGPDFLKRRFTYTKGLAWNREKMLRKIYYQSKNRNLSEQFQLLADFPTTAPCDESMNRFCLYLQQKLVIKYPKTIVKSLLPSALVAAAKFIGLNGGSAILAERTRMLEVETINICVPKDRLMDSIGPLAAKRIRSKTMLAALMIAGIPVKVQVKLRSKVDLATIDATLNSTYRWLFSNYYYRDVVASYDCFNLDKWRFIDSS